MEYLKDFLNQIEDLPEQAKVLLHEMGKLDEKIEEIKEDGNLRAEEAFKGLKEKDGDSPEDEAELKRVREDFVRAREYQDQKIAIVDYMAKALKKHCTMLDHYLEKHEEDMAQQKSVDKKKSREKEEHEDSSQSAATNEVPAADKKRPEVVRTLFKSSENSNAGAKKSSGGRKKSSGGDKKSSGGDKKSSAAQSGSAKVSKGSTKASKGSTKASKGSTKASKGASRSAAAKPVRGDVKLHCFCQRPEFGVMIACENVKCEREWFHLPCVGIVAPPKGKWWCSECAPGSS